MDGRDELGEAIALLTSNPRESLTHLERLRRRALRKNNRNDALGLLGLMVRAARGCDDRALALRLSQQLVREDPGRSGFWSTLALVEYDIARLDHVAHSRHAERFFRRAAGHYARAAETEERATEGDAAQVANYRRFEADALERVRAARAARE